MGDAAETGALEVGWKQRAYCGMFSYLQRIMVQEYVLWPLASDRMTDILCRCIHGCSM